MARKEWSRLRVVVEVPARGDLTEKQLRWEVERALRYAGLDRYLINYHDVQLGRVLVKEFGRVKAALTRATLRMF